MPEARFSQWLSQVLATTEKEGTQQAYRFIRGTRQEVRRWVGGPATPGIGGYGDASEVRPAYAEAVAAMERGDLDGAERAFKKDLAASPDDLVAKIGLAQVSLVRRVASYDQARVRRDAAKHRDDVRRSAG